MHTYLNYTYIHAYTYNTGFRISKSVYEMGHTETVYYRKNEGSGGGREVGKVLREEGVRDGQRERKRCIRKRLEGGWVGWRKGEEALRGRKSKRVGQNGGRMRNEGRKVGWEEEYRRGGE